MSDDPGSINPADLPPAAQWMLAQAGAAAQAESRAEPALTFTPLAERERRIAGGLRGNKRLAAGLDESAAGVLRDWAAALGRPITAATEGLDDAAAEPVLQQRVRAARTLLRRVAQAAADPAGRPARLSDIAPQLSIAYHPDYRRPGAREAAPFLAEWAALAGQPAARIAALRAYVEGRLAEEHKDEDGAPAP